MQDSEEFPAVQRCSIKNSSNFRQHKSCSVGLNPYTVGGFGIAPPPPSNTNVSVGYPTAYGLTLARGGNSNVAPIPSSPLSSSVRCLNGGAHIGQCRLDNDAICRALGGGCVHGACCTTPFIGLTTGSTIGPEVDGEVTRKPKKHTTTEAPVEERRLTTLCTSSLRPVGPCVNDNDCPSLHRCEAEQCCYMI